MVFPTKGIGTINIHMQKMNSPRTPYKNKLKMGHKSRNKT